MKIRILVVCVLAAASCGAQTRSTPSAQPDTPANRRAAAQRYLKAVPAEELVAGTIEQVAAQLPEERRESFKAALRKVINVGQIENITLEAVAKHFTVNEIHALTAFYSSPEGRSISRKFGAYLADVMPAIQKELEEALEEIEKEVHGP
jgi:hypothetical protein